MLKAHNHLPSDSWWLFWRAGTISQNGGSDKHVSVLLPPCIFPTLPSSLGCSPCCSPCCSLMSTSATLHVMNMQSEIIYKTRSHYILCRHVQSTWNSSQVFLKLGRFAHARYSWLCAFKSWGWSSGWCWYWFWFWCCVSVGVVNSRVTKLDCKVCDSNLYTYLKQYITQT